MVGPISGIIAKLEQRLSFFSRFKEALHEQSAKYVEIRLDTAHANCYLCSCKLLLMLTWVNEAIMLKISSPRPTLEPINECGTPSTLDP